MDSAPPSSSPVTNNVKTNKDNDDKSKGEGKNKGRPKTNKSKSPGRTRKGIVHPYRLSLSPLPPTGTLSIQDLHPPPLPSPIKPRPESFHHLAFSSDGDEDPELKKWQNQKKYGKPEAVLSHQDKNREDKEPFFFPRYHHHGQQFKISNYPTASHWLTTEQGWKGKELDVKILKRRPVDRGNIHSRWTPQRKEDKERRFSISKHGVPVKLGPGSGTDKWNPVTDTRQDVQEMLRSKTKGNKKSTKNNKKNPQEGMAELEFLRLDMWRGENSWTETRSTKGWRKSRKWIPVKKLLQKKKNLSESSTGTTSSGLSGSSSSGGPKEVEDEDEDESKSESKSEPEATPEAERPSDPKEKQPSLVEEKKDEDKSFAKPVVIKHEIIPKHWTPLFPMCQKFPIFPVLLGKAQLPEIDLDLGDEEDDDEEEDFEEYEDEEDEGDDGTVKRQKEPQKCRPYPLPFDYVYLNAKRACLLPPRVTPTPYIVDDHKGTRRHFINAGYALHHSLSPGFGKIPDYLKCRNLELGRCPEPNFSKFYQPLICKHYYGHIHCKMCGGMIPTRGNKRICNNNSTCVCCGGGDNNKSHLHHYPHHSPNGCGYNDDSGIRVTIFPYTIPNNKDTGGEGDPQQGRSTAKTNKSKRNSTGRSERMLSKSTGGGDGSTIASTGMFETTFVERDGTSKSIMLPPPPVPYREQSTTIASSNTASLSTKRKSSDKSSRKKKISASSYYTSSSSYTTSRNSRSFRTSRLFR